MMASGVPTVPGSEGIISTLEEARKFLKKLISCTNKSLSSGGGGRGMRAIFIRIN